MKSRRQFVLITAGSGAFVFLNRAWGADPVSGAAAHASSAGLDPGFVTVDMRQLFDKHPKTKDAQSKLNAQRNADRKALEDHLDVKKAELSGAAGAGNPKIRQQGGRLQNMDGEIREFQAAREKQLQDLAIRLRASIVEELNSMIAVEPAVVDAAFVFDKSGRSLNGIPFLVSSPDRMDVTGAVLKKVGADSPATPAPASAPRGLRVASVDMKKIFADFDKARDAEAKIDEKRSAAKKELEERTEVIRKANAVPEESRLRQNAADLQNLERELREFQVIQEKQLKELEARLRAGLVDAITKVVLQIAEAEQADLVFETSAPSLNGVPVFVYLNGVPDWSSTVIRVLNSGRQGGIPEQPGRANETASTTGLRFARIDMKSVFVHLPATKKAEAAINEKRAWAKDEVAKGADPKAREKELSDLSARLRGEIVEKINKTLAERASQSGYQVVIDSSGSSLNGVPVALRVGGGVPDLTQEIVQALGGAKD